MSASRPFVCDLALEKLVLGELDAAEARSLQAAIDADESLRQRLREIEESNRAILERYPAEKMVPRIGLKLERAQPSRRAFLPWPVLVSVPMAAAVALLLIFGAIDPSPPPSPAGLEPTRVKGDSAPALFVYRQNVAGEELLTDGQSAGTGDVLQLRYAGRGMKYGVIFSLDGRGKVTRHMPLSGAYAQSLATSGVGTLPMSYALDDAPVMERFYFVTANHKFEVEKLLESAEELAAGVRASLELPRDAVAVTFTVTKR